MKENTKYGFIWDNLHVERISEEKGSKYIYICTDKQHMVIRITKGGKIKPEEVNTHRSK